MFIVSIFGGLGSQMDQYSFAMALQKHYPNVSIKFDIFNLYPKEHSGYMLDKVFGIRAEEASIGEIMSYSDRYPLTAKHQRIMRALTSLKCILFGPKCTQIKPDDASAYYKEVFELDPLKPYLFFGNWMNELYRIGIESKIKETFRFPEFNDDKNKEIAQKIKATDSVSIHVRHGDYKNYGFPVLSLDYYKAAVKIMESKVKVPHYFVFSDDVNYIKGNFSFLKNYTIVENNLGENSFRDMQLMSLCKHNIIANSSFSYWGAYLNANQDATIIAPRYHIPSCKYPFAKSSWVILDNNK